MNLTQNKYKYKRDPNLKVGAEFKLNGVRCKITKISNSIRFIFLEDSRLYRHVNGINTLTHDFLKNIVWL